MAQGSRKAGGGLARPVQPSADLAAICGNAPLPRSQVVSKVWDHIRKNNLQNPQNKREILADDKLKKVFGGKDRVSMFEMNKHLSNHLKEAPASFRHRGDPLRRVPFFVAGKARLGGGDHPRQTLSRRSWVTG
jgi:hypothetical protein